jgi:hypothetical protein
MNYNTGDWQNFQFCFICCFGYDSRMSTFSKKLGIDRPAPEIALPFGSGLRDLVPF